MNTKDKIKIISPLDSEGRVALKQLPENISGDLRSEIDKFFAVTKGVPSMGIVYSAKKDELTLNLIVYDLCGKAINELHRVIEDSEKTKDELLEVILQASEQNFLEQAQKQIILNAAQEQLKRVYDSAEKENKVPAVEETIEENTGEVVLDGEFAQINS